MEIKSIKSEFEKDKNEKYSEWLKQQESLLTGKNTERQALEDSYKSRVTELESQLQNLKDNLEQKKASYASLNDDFKKSNEDLSRLMAEISGVREERDELRENNKKVTREYLELQNEYTTLEFKNKSLIEQIALKGETYEGKEQLIVELENQKREMTNTIQSLKKSLMKAEDTVEKAQEEIKKGNDIIKSIQEKFTKKKSELKELISENARKQKELENRNVEILQTTRELNEKDLQSKKDRQEIDRLSDDNKRLENLLEETRRNLDENQKMVSYLNSNLNNQRYPLASSLPRKHVAIGEFNVNSFNTLEEMKAQTVDRRLLNESISKRSEASILDDDLVPHTNFTKHNMGKTTKLDEPNQQSGMRSSGKTSILQNKYGGTKNKSSRLSDMGMFDEEAVKK